MKHISEYTKEEIIKCLQASGVVSNFSSDTEKLRQVLSDFIQDGDAPTLEETKMKSLDLLKYHKVRGAK